MIPQTEIVPVVAAIVKKRIKYDADLKGYSSTLRDFFGNEKKQPRPEMPDYYPGYRLAVDWLQQIRPHSEKGCIPMWLFENFAPNMTEAEKEYQIATFKQDTIEVFKDTVDTYSRAFHESNYDIEFPEQGEGTRNTDLSFRDYVTTGVPIYGSLETFTFDFLPSLKMMDAMGVVVPLPGIFQVKQVEGEDVIDPDSLIEPYPQFFHATKVVYFDEVEKYCVIESEDRSLVLYQGKQVEEGLTYWVIDDKAYYKVEQYGKKTDWLFREILVLEHELGYMPARRVRGEQVQIDEVFMEQSPFLFAVDTLDRILIDSAQLSGAKTNGAFPYRIMIGDECEATYLHQGETIKCADGYFRFGGNQMIKCDTCEGTGLKDRVTKTGVMIIKPQNSTGQGDGITPDKAMFYASPSAEILDFLRREIDNYFTKAYNLLHLYRDAGETTVNPDETATGVRDKNKSLVAGIKTFCDQLFDLLEWLNKTIGMLRYGQGFTPPRVIRPINYDFFTIEEYMDMISKAITSNQPPFIVQSVVEHAGSRVFFKEDESRKKFDLIKSADRLMTLTNEAIDKRVAQKLADPWEVVLHDSIQLFIEQEIAADKKFLEKEMPEKVELLRSKARALLASFTPAPAATVLGAPRPAADRLNGILNGIN